MLMSKPRGDVTGFVRASLLALLAAACTPLSAEAPSGDLSAVEHRASAAVHDRKALEYEQQIDADWAETWPLSDSEDEGGADWPISGYELTAGHLARQHREHAVQHRDTARALELFEEVECLSIPSENRALCPWEGSVERVEEIPGGVRVHLPAGIESGPLVDGMRCHHAFGAARAYEGMNACPLYLRDIRIRREGPHAIEITSTDIPTVGELHRRVRSLDAP